MDHRNYTYNCNSLGGKITCHCRQLMYCNVILFLKIMFHCGRLPSKLKGEIVISFLLVNGKLHSQINATLVKLKE